MPIKYYDLIVQLTKREVKSKYKGSLLGQSWAIVNPVLMLLVYTFVFSIAFKAKWGVNESKSDFALNLFAGLLIYNYFNSVILAMPDVIKSHSNFVKKIVFPLEILVLVKMFSEAYNLIIGLIVFLFGYLFVYNSLSPNIVQFFLVLAPFFAMVAGISFVLAALSVFLKDIIQIVGFLMSVLMFMSPLFYPIENIPIEYRWLVQSNPLSPALIMGREALFSGEGIDFIYYFKYCVASILTLVFGIVSFKKLSSGFADVI